MTKMIGVPAKNFGRDQLCIMDTPAAVSEGLNRIFEKVKDGERIDNTIECPGFIVDLYFPYMTTNSMLKNGIKSFYWAKTEQLKVSLNLDMKYGQEYFHYRKLEFELRALIEREKYYGGSYRRRIVAHSNDCISTIQILPLNDYPSLFAFIRSSDILGLFPVDLLGLFEIMQNLHSSISAEKAKGYRMTMLIGSAHLYINKKGELSTRDMIKEEENAS